MPRKFRVILNYWLPPLLLSFAILALSGELGSSGYTLRLVKWVLNFLLPSLPLDQINAIHHYLRKLGHITAYGILYLLWFRNFQGHLRHTSKLSFLGALVLCLLIASLDETHQALLPSRSGSLRDVVLDITGAALAAAVNGIILKSRSKTGPRGGIIN